MARITGDESGQDAIAVVGNATGQNSLAVLGQGDAVGVRGEGKTWHGVAGLSQSTTGGHGVYGKNTAGGTGVVGESDGWMGVYGKSQSTTGGAGVMGEGDPAPGVIGKSTKWIGVYGETAGIENGPAGVWGEHKGAGVGVKAVSRDGFGLAAYSAGHEAIHAETRSPETAAIAAYNLNPTGRGAAIFAKKEGTQGHAGFLRATSGSVVNLRWAKTLSSRTPTVPKTLTSPRLNQLNRERLWFWAKRVGCSRVIKPTTSA